jgi:hypothetical protein
MKTEVEKKPYTYPRKIHRLSAKGGIAMKKSALIIVSIFLLLTATAKAQNKEFGIGVILGEPTGISLKKWLGDHSAIDGAVAWSFGGVNSFHLHADYLYHNFNLFDVESGQLPLYFGAGFRFRTEPEATLGVRFPVGICYIFEKAPLDIFLELGPVLNLIPDMEFWFTGSIGARFYFKKSS